MLFDEHKSAMVGDTGELSILPDDEVAKKLFMLLEGECESIGPTKAAEKHGYTRQRYFQLRKKYEEHGSRALLSQRRGPKTKYRRTPELERQVIRLRFFDPEASPDVIAQKLRQIGFRIATRSVERVIAHYGLQKKTLSMPSREEAPCRSAGAQK
jgi:hypothetical protein